MTPKGFILHIEAKCENNFLCNVTILDGILSRVASIAEMSVLNSGWCDVGIDAQRLGREPRPDETGFSLWKIITTSHICLHTWPESNFIMFDLVSCKEFDAGKVKNYIFDIFKIARVDKLIEG